MIHNVTTFGCIPDDTNTATAFSNSQALSQAISAAHKDSSDKEVLIPAGTFIFMPIAISNIAGVTLTIEGLILVSTDNTSWPKDSDKINLNFITLTDSSEVVIRGSGTVDGQG